MFKLNTYLPYDPTILNIYPREIKTWSERQVYPNFLYDGFTHDGKKLETDVWIFVNAYVRWKDWCWSWNSSTLATWCEELMHWKRPWCWERLRARGEGDNRGWDGWTASSTRWAWVSVDSRGWWWTGRPGVLRFMGSQRVRHDWVTELK